MYLDKQITVMVPTSPIPSHPSTEVIEKVLASIRFHLPESPIIVMADGVRPSVEHRRAQYDEYKKNLAAMLPKYGDITMREFAEPSQQAIMMRECLVDVKTRLILFVEHDCFLVTNWNPLDANGITLPESCAIEWRDIYDILVSRTANMVRFYAWEKIFPAHNHLMQGEFMYNRARFVRTRQYSQWPNIATTEFYKRILTKYFAPTDKKMIETVMASPVLGASWDEFRIVIYNPLPSARRFYHLNARVGADGIKDAGEW